MFFWKTTQTIFIFILLSLCKADFEDIESKAFSIKIKELIQDSLKVKDMQVKWYKQLQKYRIGLRSFCNVLLFYFQNVHILRGAAVSFSTLSKH